MNGEIESASELEFGFAFSSVAYVDFSSSLLTRAKLPTTNYDEPCIESLEDGTRQALHNLLLNIRCLVCYNFDVCKMQMQESCLAIFGIVKKEDVLIALKQGRCYLYSNSHGACSSTLKMMVFGSPLNP
nr:hypothetical protein Iba_chr06bCG10810 [Ipomoea batatas]